MIFRGKIGQVAVIDTFRAFFMVQNLQKLFYRVSKAGADVYRIDLQNRLRRLDLEKIAAIDVAENTITVLSGKKHSAEETNDMKQWRETRQGQLDMRSQNDINRLVEAMNHAANWIENTASNDQIENISDPVLMAMHDLRATLVRKMAARINQK